MKYVKQFLIILGISLLGEVLKFGLSLPIPASIYGMAVLFICLMTGIVKLDDVREAGKFLIEIMPMLFIPAGWIVGKRFNRYFFRCASSR